MEQLPEFLKKKKVYFFLLLMLLLVNCIKMTKDYVRNTVTIFLCNDGFINPFTLISPGSVL